MVRGGLGRLHRQCMRTAVQDRKSELEGTCMFQVLGCVLRVVSGGGGWFILRSSARERRMKS